MSGPAIDTPPEPTYTLVTEGLFPEITRLKASGSIMFIIAGITAMLPMVLGEGGLEPSPQFILAVGLAAGGIATGLAGLFSPSIRRTAIMVAPVLLVGGAAASAPGASLESIPPMELALAFAFAASWILAIEHLHAVMRFVELGAYVTRQRLTTFSLGGVVNHFQVYGAGLVGIILVVAAVVVVGVPWVFSKGSSEAFGRSVELNSVFGVALATAVVFTLSALILVFVRSVIPQRVEVERVAYSRDRMEDMLRSGQIMERGDETQRR
jgi:hypothetical protein